jgi:hypothetical protein
MQYYVIDSRRLSLAEYWRIAPRGKFLIALLYKLLGKPLNLKTFVPRIADPTVLSEAEVQAMGGEVVLANLKVMESLGYRRIFFYTIPAIGPVKGCCAVSLSSDGRTCGQILYVVSTRPLFQASVSLILCMSRRPDGVDIVTVNRAQKLASRPNVDIARYLNAGPEEILAKHQQRIAGLDLSVFDTERMKQFVVEMNNREIDFHAQRGVYVPVSEETVRLLQAGQA